MLHEIEGVEREIRGARGPDAGRDGEGRDARRRGQARGAGLQDGRRATRRRAAARWTRRSGASRQTRIGWRRSATRSPPRSRRALLDALQPRGPRARHRRWPRPRGRRCAAVPREAAPADVRGPEAHRRDLPVPRSATASCTTRRRCRWSSPSREALTGLTEPDLVIHIDGASRGNPGEAGFGVHVEATRTASVAELYGYLGRATNNVAEYQALLHALRYALERRAPPACASSRTPSWSCGRSTGEYKVKHPDMIPLHREASSAPAPVRARDASPTCGASRTTTPTAWPTARSTSARRSSTDARRPPDEADHAAGSLAVAPVRVVPVGQARRAVGDIVDGLLAPGRPRRAARGWRRARRDGRGRAGRAGRSARRRGRTRPPLRRPTS